MCRGKLYWFKESTTLHFDKEIQGCWCFPFSKRLYTKHLYSLPILRAIFQCLQFTTLIHGRRHENQRNEKFCLAFLIEPWPNIHNIKIFLRVVIYYDKKKQEKIIHGKGSFIEEDNRHDYIFLRPQDVEKIFSRSLSLLFWSPKSNGLYA